MIIKGLIKKLLAGRRCANWNGLLSGLLILALLAPVLVMSPTPDVAPRTQPVLLEMAAERPDSMLDVIVQKLVRDASVERSVARLGGVITKDLWIINAFAAELPAKAVPELGRAAGVRWVSLDAPMVRSSCDQCIDTANLLSYYVQAIGADQLWNEGPHLQGQGVTVAVVDSGIDTHDDLNDAEGFTRILENALFNTSKGRARDHFGHGTYVAGVIGGSGHLSQGTYIGVAPGVNFVNVKVTDREGAGNTSDVVDGLQWVYEHKDEYDIRVVNLSLNSSVPESYHTSPLDAALEILWFNEIVVVVSAGNNGEGLDNGILYPPANDPFVITVGATDDMGTPGVGDDVLASFSAYGTTADGFAKPDLVAPGVDVISLLPTPPSILWREHRDHRVEGPGKGPDHYFRMSGTSVASAVTAGAVALLLQDEPDLNPDQVKYRLMATARSFDDPCRAGAGYLDIYAAVHGDTTETVNTGIEVSQLLWTGEDPPAWGSVNWTSVNWTSVNWTSVNWTSVNWTSVNWTSDQWDD
jgi:serine protease AprX